MKAALSFLALAATTAFAAPQGVTETIEPEGDMPDNCKADFDGQFQVTVVKPMAKRDLSKRQSSCGKEGVLTLKLDGGVLTDAQGRTGYIADNYQFQFDAPPQTGATVTGGFSVCQNSTDLEVLGLGATTVFYQCLSGDFYNLYNTNWAPQCSPVSIQVLPCSGSTSDDTDVDASPGATITTGGGNPDGAPATVLDDGQPQATSAAAVAPPMVTVIADGQPQAQSAIPLAQLPDGQPNMPTGLIGQLGDGQPQVTTGAAAVPGPTGAPVSQISDGQIQAANATGIIAPTLSSSILIAGGAMPTVVAEFAAVAAGVAAMALL